MNVIEIVKRPSPQYVTQEEMEFVVKQYIKEKKGVDVDINLEAKLDRRNPFFGLFIQEQLKSLNDAFLVSSEYFVNLDNESSVL